MKKIISFSNMPFRISVSDIKFKSIHYHPEVVEMIFVLEGRLAVTVGQRSIFVEKGEFIAINPGELHCIQCETTSTIVSQYFNLDHYQQRFPYIRSVRFRCAHAEMRPAQLPYWDELRNFFIRLMLMHNKSTKRALGIMQDLSDNIIHLLWLHFQERRELPESALERYYSISNYLYRNFQTDISATQVAEHERISPTRLAHFWKDATGMSVRQSITALRLAEAERMLLETPLTVNEVAYRCGFSDEKYFYQHFKSCYKLTPNEYRIRHLEDRRQTMRVLLARKESEQHVRAYSLHFYVPRLPPSLPSLTEPEMQKELVLGHLYEAILCNPYTVVTEFQATKQDVGYMQISPNHALFLQDGKYRINWEYVYAQMHIFMDFQLKTEFLIDYDCMPIDEWRPLLSDFVDELLTIWGKTVVEAQQYSIHSKVIPDYLQCIDLAEYLKNNTAVRNAKAIYML